MESVYTGTHWYKCDLHLHTMSSRCYVEKDNTPEQWMARAKERGLDCIAITDHNDYRSIDTMIELGGKYGIAVLPGVEITCDTSKIHMLIIFNTDKSGSTVRDFLSKCDIDSELVGSTAGTDLSVFEVCRIAKKKGAMVIASHIDEFSSISNMNPANLDKILDPEYIDGVQVVNYPVWMKYRLDKDKDAMLLALKNEYGTDEKGEPLADEEDAERWRKAFDRAENSGIPMLAASDNPYSEDDTTHGLYGIGRTYTWIKMNDKVDLESIRQSLYSPDSRIRLCWECPGQPELEPDFWIKYAEFRRTSLNPYENIRLDFSPQLNCMIGGRGSGKSAIVRLLSGIFDRSPDPALSDNYLEQLQFYGSYDEQTGNGIFAAESEIEISFIRYKKEYKLLVSDISSLNDQKLRLFRRTETGASPAAAAPAVSGTKKLNFTSSEAGTENDAYTAAAAPENETGAVWEELGSEWLSFMEMPRVFPQKYIYELSKKPDTLMHLIDAYIPDIQDILKNREYFKALLLFRLQLVRYTGASAEIESCLLAEISDLREQLALYPDRAAYINERLTKADSDLSYVKRMSDKLSQLCAERDELFAKYQETYEAVRKLRCELLTKAFENDANSRLELESFANRHSFEVRLLGLLKTDDSFIRNDIELVEEVLFNGKNRLENYRLLLKLIKDSGKASTASMSETASGSVSKSASANAAGHVSAADSANRHISGQTSGNVPANVSAAFRGLSQNFIRLIKQLPDRDFDKLYIFLPEDDLRFYYKSSDGKKFFPINTASAGQKAIAILSFILAAGNSPVIIDQPEDDLDNRLVYELVLGRLKQAKQKRQLILVTHNANIPVNGDAEYIICMDQWSKFRRIRKQGTLDDDDIRSEICDIMEGTERAFEQRARKYHISLS